MPHRLFLPRKKHRSPVLSVYGLIIANIFLLVLIVSRIGTLNHFDLNILGFATDINITDLLNETNAQRTSNGLNPLTYNQTLANAARNKANDMFTDDYWAHIAPDGTTPWDFIVGSGYRYSYAGENLAKDFTKSRNVVSAWMDSPTHRDNLLNRNYTEIGFAVVNGVLNGEETTLVVQMFGRPLALANNVNQEDSSVEQQVGTQVIQQQEPQVVDIASLETQEELQLATQSQEVETVFNEDPVVITNTAYEGSDLDTDVEVFVIDKAYVNYFAYLLLGFFSLSLIIDGFVAYKRGYNRVTGNTITHILFFCAAIIFLILIQHPKIL